MPSFKSTHKRCYKKRAAFLKNTKLAVDKEKFDVSNTKLIQHINYDLVLKYCIFYTVVLFFAIAYV